MSKRLKIYWFFFLLLLGLFGACTPQPQPRPLQASPSPRPTRLPPSPTPKPTPPPSVKGAELPGRLLFVQRGTIWLWQGQKGKPLLGEGNAWQPAWSPDGLHLAYIERGESYSDVMLSDATGSDLLQLTSNSSDAPPASHEHIYGSRWAFYPTWNPDGSRLLLASQVAPPVGSPAAEYRLALFLLSPASGGYRQIYAEPNAHCGKMVLLPDGQTLLYTRMSVDPGGEQQIYWLNWAAEEPKGNPFPGAPPNSYDPAISPDGQWLAFAAQKKELTDLWVLPAKAIQAESSPPGPTEDSSPTPSPQRLTNLGTARAPAFSPDQKMLAFLAIPPNQVGFELWIANLSLSKKGTLVAQPPHQITFGLGLDPDSGLSWAK